MKNKHRFVLIFLAVLLFTAGCRMNDGPEKRYRLEKKLWNAQLLERSTQKNIHRYTHRYMKSSLDAFMEIINEYPARSSSVARWDPKIVNDVRLIVLSAKISLADIYLTMDLHHLAGMVYENFDMGKHLEFKERLDQRFDLPAKLYVLGKQDSVYLLCEEKFYEIINNKDFWRRGTRIKESFLDIPLFLMRYYKSRGITTKWEMHARSGEHFYNRIILEWPEHSIAEAACIRLCELHVHRENWKAAMEEIDKRISQPDWTSIAPRLWLMKGELLLHALKKNKEAESAFEGIMAAYPSSPEAFEAKIELAEMLFRKGDVERALQSLKELDKRYDAPYNARARAMLMTAHYFEKSNRWDQANLMLKRMMNIYEKSPSALEAPLLMISHYLKAGEKAVALKKLDDARELYFSLIKRNDGLIEDKLITQDYLVATYLLFDKAEEIASILGSESKYWGGVVGPAGLYKSAMIYRNYLNDTATMAKVLKDCIERYPDTWLAERAEYQMSLLN